MATDALRSTQTLEIHVDPEVREVFERVSHNLERVGELLQENVALLRQALERPSDLVGGSLHVS